MDIMGAAEYDPLKPGASSWHRVFDARRVIGHLRIFLEFKQYLKNPELPTACDERPFTMVENAAILDPTKPTC